MARLERVYVLGLIKPSPGGKPQEAYGLDLLLDAKANLLIVRARWGDYDTVVENNGGQCLTLFDDAPTRQGYQRACEVLCERAHQKLQRSHFVFMSNANTAPPSFDALPPDNALYRHIARRDPGVMGTRVREAVVSTLGACRGAGAFSFGRR